MSRGEVTRFLREFWWQVGTIVLLVVGWVAQVQAAVNDMGELRDAASLMESLGRLECLRDRQRASLAGVPCGELLRDWGLR